MVDLSTLLPAAGLGGAATWAGQATVAYFRSRNERAAKKDDTDATLEQHRDKLTFELLRAAREEVAAARSELDELRGAQIRLIHFDEALDHIEALLLATDDADRRAAERRAQQFLTRMKRFAEAAGTVRNETQVELSKQALQGISDASKPV